MRLCPALRHAPIICRLLLCFYGFRRCCTAPPLGTNLARLGLEFCWGSAVSQACLTDAFIGHVHLRAYMSSYPPCAYISMLLSMLLLCFYGFRRCCTAPPLGMNLLFRKQCPPAMRLCPALRHAPIICTLLLCVYGFRRCCTAPPLGTNLARLGFEFRCFPSMPHGRVHRPCPPIRAYMSSYPRRAYNLHAFVHAFAVFLRVSKMLYRHAPTISTLLLCVYGFRRCCTAPPLGTNLARLGFESCWGSAVSQACLTDAFIGHVHLRAYMSSYPPGAYISMLLSMLLLCFYGFRRCCTAPPLGMNLARLGLEFCWVPLFRKHASRTRSSAMSTCHAYMSSSPPCAYYMHAFALCLRVSKMLYGTASGDVVTFRLAPLANNLSDLRIGAHAHPTLLSLLLGVGGMGGSP